MEEPNARSLLQTQQYDERSVWGCVSISRGDKLLFAYISELLLFICVSFNDAISSSEYIASNDESERIWKDAVKA